MTGARSHIDSLRDDPLITTITAGALVGAAVQLRLGRFDGTALGLAVAGVALLTWSLGRPAPGPPSPLRRPVVLGLVALQVLALVPLAWEVFAGDPTWLVSTAVVAAVAAAVLAWDLLRPVPRLPGFGPTALVTMIGALGLCWIAAQGTNIDVFHFQQTGAERLLAGENPYLPGYPNPYDPSESANFYGPGLADGDRLDFGFPYPPLSLLLSTVGHLASDVRIAHLLAVVAAGWLALHLVENSWASRAGGVLLLTSPMLLPIVQRGFTEAFLILALVLTVYVLRRPTRHATAVVTLGLFLAVKQYAVLFLPVLLVVGPRWRTAGEWWRAAWQAIAVATLVTLPMALWDLGEFLHSAVWLQFQQPFREDAMSLPAQAVRLWNWPGAPLALAGIVLAIAVALWWVLRRAPRTWTGAAAGSALVMLAFLLFNKQAFTNYFMFAVGAVWLAVAAVDDRSATSGRDAVISIEDIHPVRAAPEGSGGAVVT